jgi:hypothetical protein
MIGKKIYFEEPWEWESDEDALYDENGDIVNVIYGEWTIISVDGDSTWIEIEFMDRDFQIELPTEYVSQLVN